MFQGLICPCLLLDFYLLPNAQHRGADTEVGVFYSYCLFYWRMSAKNLSLFWLISGFRSSLFSLWIPWSNFFCYLLIFLVNLIINISDVRSFKSATDCEMLILFLFLFNHLFARETIKSLFYILKKSLTPLLWQISSHYLWMITV